jgi:thiol-disulfide isomerase/thioredoxin
MTGHAGERRIRHMPQHPRRRTLLSLAAAAAAGWSTASGQPATAPAEAPLPAVGAPLSLAALDGAALLTGGRFAAAQADRRVLVLYWWASWCPFCAVQSPEVERLWREQGPRGLQVLGLSIDRRAEDAAAYVQRRGYTFPSAWVTPEIARGLPKPKGLPITVVRGRDGRVAMAEAGQLFPEDVQAIARFLPG